MEGDASAILDELAAFYSGLNRVAIVAHEYVARELIVWSPGFTELLEGFSDVGSFCWSVVCEVGPLESDFADCFHEPRLDAGGFKAASEFSFAFLSREHVDDRFDMGPRAGEQVVVEDDVSRLYWQCTKGAFSPPRETE